MLEQRSPSSYGCKLCKKTAKRRCEVRYHIERAHVTGFVHYCDMCGKAHSNRKALSDHMTMVGHRPPPKTTKKIPVRPEEVDEAVKSMMEYGKFMGLSAKGQKIRSRICKVCGNEGRMNTIMKHIEKYHIETGVPNSCKDCGKSFAVRAALQHHQKGVFCFTKKL